MISNKFFDQGHAQQAESASYKTSANTQSISASFGKRWYVVHTQPRSELRAAANLRQQAFKVFCPSEKRVIRHARKVTEVMAPLFPCYVFVRLDLSVDRWRVINGTRGAVRIIANGDSPVAVPNGVVESLERRTNLDGAIDWGFAFNVGDQVSIIEGPFAQMIGMLEQLDASGRVQLLLDIHGRTVRVSVSAKVIATPH